MSGLIEAIYAEIGTTPDVYLLEDLTTSSLALGRRRSIFCVIRLERTWIGSPRKTKIQPYKFASRKIVCFIAR